ncbi:hypothetical protein HYDPIDRAFT_43382 [Hydnomerulius pinastri MD-312]|uniref:DUF7918 domain-containing protein n=1 Tax=Hydnomerulius pinastri MD-312 TaxID=994086 RepID=A0A0C9WAT6_9AGAM|nr:hypothetical protein HYDPIDRAFT_43382 [Hydnomerulius pinastri MD-312]
MLHYKQFSAWIEVDGHELEEYGVEGDLEKNVVVCWIASQIGKNFSINWKDKSPFRDYTLASYPKLDGTSVGGMALRPSNFSGLKETSTPIITLKDVVTSMTSVRRYMFSKLNVTDEDEYLDQSGTHLGEIVLEIWKAEINGPRMIKTGSSATHQSTVHERSKKAISHCVGYGEEEQAAPRSVVSSQRVGSKPLVTFIFKYRDYSLLQANGIIPPPANNKRRASSDEALGQAAVDVKEKSNVAAIRALDDAIRSLREQRASLLSKRSNTGGSQPPAKRVKREGEYISSGEVIDLT